MPYPMSCSGAAFQVKVHLYEQGHADGCYMMQMVALKLFQGSVTEMMMFKVYFTLIKVNGDHMISHGMYPAIECEANLVAYH